MVASTPATDAAALETGLRKQAWVRRAVYWLGAAIAVLHLVMNFTTIFSTQWQSTLHFVGLGMLAVLLYPPLRSERLAGSKWMLVLDLVVGVVFVGATILVVWAEDAIYGRGAGAPVWRKRGGPSNRAHIGCPPA